MHPDRKAEKEGRVRSPYYFDKLTLDQDGKRFLSMTGAEYPLDAWKMRIGLHTFDIPPLAVSVSEVNSNMQTAYLLRAKTASKSNPGKKIRQISMTFIFPNISKGDIRLWGSVGDGSYRRKAYTYEGNDSLYSNNRSDKIALNNPLVLDSASFRGFIAQFQNSPFLPVYNTYLNDVFGIQAVGLVSMSASTVPGLPNTIQIELIMYEFNWKAYVPNAGSFDEIFIKERYQDYFVRSIKKLHDYVSVPFSNEWLKSAIVDDTLNQTTYNQMYEKFLTDNYGPLEEEKNSLNAIELFWSDRQYQKLNWLNSLVQYDQQNKTYDLPQGGTLLSQLENMVFNKLFNAFFSTGGNGDKDLKGVLNAIAGTSSEETNKAFNAINSIVNLTDFYLTNGSRDSADLQQDILLAEEVVKKTAYQKTYPPDMIRMFAIRQVLIKDNGAWIQRILNDPAIKQAFTSDTVVFKGEWEIPMKRMGLMHQDLRRNVILENVTVTTQNAIAAMPIVGKTTPALQHLGGLGTKISLSFKVIGEAAIQHFQKTFDAMNEGALANKNIVVSSVVGIQNELVNLFGVKYVLVDSWQVDTIPNYPHSYSVVIQLSDFDIFQQKRETPQTRSGNLQYEGEKTQDLLVRELRAMTESNSPFTRMRQLIPEYNAYPDLPLPTYNYEVHSLDFSLDEKGRTIVSPDRNVLKRSRYFDPDYYFRRVEFIDLMKNDDGSLVPFDSTTARNPSRVFNENGEVAEGIKKKQVMAFVGGNEIGSTDPIGAAPSMQGALITEFDSNTTDGGGRYNIKIDYKNREVFGQVTELEPDDDIFAERSSKIQQYLNGNWIDVDPETAQDPNLLTAATLRANMDMAGVLFQTTSSIWGSTGYENGTLQDQPLAEDSLSGSVQLSPAETQETIDEIEFASKTALFNMYQQDERESFNHMLLDMKYRETSGRMIQAFPNYVIYVIDEGGSVHGFKLFDTFYGMQSAISMDILLDKDAPMDTAIVQFSNLSSRLSQAEWYNNTSMPEFIKRWYTSIAANTSRMYGIITDAKGYFEIAPGMRVQIRLGYSANAENLPVVFNGTIVSADTGTICTVVAAGDGVELNVCTGPNIQKNQTTLTHFGIPIVDATSVILQLLAANGSKWQEMNQKAWAGMNPGETAESSGHFGAILWDTSSMGGDMAWRARQLEFQKKISKRANNMAEKLDKAATDPKYSNEQSAKWSEMMGLMIKGGLTTTGGISMDVIDNYVTNLTSLKRDYEIYRRNIYPTANGGYRDYVNQATKAYQSPSDGWMGLIKSVVSPDQYIDDATTVWFDGDGGWVEDIMPILIGFGVGVAAGVGAGILAASAGTALAVAAGVGSGPVGWVILGGAAIIGLAVGIFTGGAVAAAGTNLAGQTWRTRRITLNTGGKTNWQIMCDAASTTPNYVLGVRPFEQRSTLFFGKPNWIYTSGVMPLFEPETLQNMKGFMGSSVAGMQAGKAGNEMSAEHSNAIAFWPEYSGSNTGMWYIPGEDYWFYYWLNDKKTIVELAKKLTSSRYLGEDMSKFTWKNIKEETDPKQTAAEAAAIAAAAASSPLALLIASSGQIPGTMNESSIGKYATAILTGEAVGDFTPKGPLSEFTAWMKNSPIVNDYFVMRASVEMELYKCTILSTETPRLHITQVGGGIVAGPMGPITFGDMTINHHLAYRYCMENETMAPTQTRGREWSFGRSAALKIDIELDDMWAFIWRIGADILIPGIIGLLATGPIGAVVGGIIGLVIGAGFAVKELGTLKLYPNLSDPFEEILWAYRAWTRSEKNDDGEDVLSKADLEHMSNLISPNSPQMQYLGRLSVGGNPFGAIDCIQIDVNATAANAEAGTLEKSMEALSKGYLSVEQAEAAKAAKEASEKAAAGTNLPAEPVSETTKLFAAFVGMATGNADMLIGSTVVGETAANLAWDCLQDSIYYGIMGTPEDPYKFDKYEGWEILKEKGGKGATDEDAAKISEATGKTVTKEDLQGQTYINDEKKLLTPSQMIIRRWQRLTDNPFSKEYGEPVVEIREPFARWHYATSETNIIGNTVMANSKNGVYNKVTAIAHTSGKNEGEKQLVAQADSSIPPSYIKEFSVDTGYNYQLFSSFDEVNHKNMARYHLKKALQQMYGGELTLLGDPFMKPYDFLYMFDAVNAMHGTCEIGRVTHSFDAQNGYTTSIVLEPIIAVDDAYQFGWTTTNWAMREEEAIRQYAAQNIMMGFANQDMVDSSLSEVQARQKHQETLGVLDQVLQPTTVVGGPQLTCSTLLQNAMNLSRDTASMTDEEKTAYEKEKADHKRIYSEAAGLNSWNIWGQAAGDNAVKEHEAAEAAAAAKLAKDAGIEDGKPTEFRDNNSAVEAADLLISAISFGKDTISLGGYTTKLVGVGGSIAGLFSAIGGVVGGSVFGGLIGIFAGIWGVTKVREWAVEFAESEPIAIILLNKDGQPLQAGLKGADGIIVGKALTMGWVSDYVNLSLPTRMDETVYTKLGISVTDSIAFRKAKTYAEKIASLKIIEKSGSAESFDIRNFPPFIAEVTVDKVTDGDTINISGPITDPATGVVYEFPRGAVRLWGINAPETEKYLSGEAPSQVGGEECKIAMKQYIHESGDKVKLVFNPLNMKDAYGRGLAIILGKGTSPHYDVAEEWIASGNATLADLFMESLNMRLVNDFFDKGWVSNLYVIGESATQQGIKQLMDEVKDAG